MDVITPFRTARGKPCTKEAIILVVIVAGTESIATYTVHHYWIESMMNTLNFSASDAELTI